MTQSGSLEFGFECSFGRRSNFGRTMKAVRAVRVFEFVRGGFQFWNSKIKSGFWPARDNNLPLRPQASNVLVANSNTSFPEHLSEPWRRMCEKLNSNQTNSLPELWSEQVSPATHFWARKVASADSELELVQPAAGSVDTSGGGSECMRKRWKVERERERKVKGKR